MQQTKSSSLILLCIGIFLCWFSGCGSTSDQQKIDRHALVNRHNVQVNSIDSLASLSVGNGEFAFTVGATGLQTFPEFYEKGIPLGTQSQWGWHSFPNPDNYTMEDVTETYPNGNGRQVPYAVQWDEGRAAAATHWLRTNPHRLHLGIVGLILQKENGKEVKISDIKNVDQKLNLWTGKIDSRYTIEGEPVHVELLAHQDSDQISVRIQSPLIEQNRLKVKFRFPYGSDCHVCPGYDWNQPEKHQTTEVESSSQNALLERKLDSTTYFMAANWEGEGEFVRDEKHRYELIPGASQESFSFNVLFSDHNPKDNPLSFEETEQNSRKNWEAFWTEGAVVDFSGSTDPRADELERRVVLSQYLTKIQTSGSLPPAETGLTMNSWYGKFHLEMHWWHGVHYALWDRVHLLEKSMPWYNTAMPGARGTAKWQGYDGVRWQKMTGPGSRKGPSDIGEFLVWQQPNFIYFAELFYRQNPNRETLDRFKERVFATADFMASFATKKEESDGKYHLTPPLIPAQEVFNAETTTDPPFELAYWRFGLSVAQEWRNRLGLSPDEEWQTVLDNLAPLPQKEGLYLPEAQTPDAYTDDQYRHDHPIVTGVLGMLPNNSMIDTAVMSNTFDEVMHKWDWQSTWGWDYPMMAMSAARLGRPEAAVDALMMDVQKNTYLKNGHNYQNERLRLYLPGNGGVLTAVAMMAAGWDGAPDRHAPGFPENGWTVRWEGLHEMP